MTTFFEFISQIFSFIWTMISSFVNVLLMIAKGVVYIFNAVSYMPEYFQIAVIPFISLAIVYFVMNRG